MLITTRQKHNYYIIQILVHLRHDNIFFSNYNIMFVNLKKMCTPATVYFAISITTLVAMILLNWGNRNKLCMGEFECPVDNIYVIYVVKLAYLLFVTIILDSLCKNGYASISWFLVFFPVLFYFLALGMFMIKQNSTVIVIQ